MKRHPSLIPLSREHHDGLILATRLQQGRNALLRLWSHDLHWQAEYVVKFFDEKLDKHFRIEEGIVFPTAQVSVADAIHLIEELCEEHEEMRTMVEFFRHPTQKKLECTLTRFGQVLEEHIRREERELFPRCETDISFIELETMGRAIREQLSKENS